MKVKYIGHRRRDVVPATGAREFSVSPGETVEVDDATGKSLLRQTRRFRAVSEPKAPKPDKDKGVEINDNA